MARYIGEESEMVSELVNFKWIIKNFSVESLQQRGSPIRSPTFNCLNTDFHLQMSRSSDKIHLDLVQSDADDPPWIIKGYIGFDIPNNVKWCCKRIKPSKKRTNVSFDISVNKMKKECLADNVLTVFCSFTAATLKHTLEAQSVTQTTDVSRSVSSRMPELAENIGTFLANPRFSDVNLKIGEEVLQAHKVILACRSKAFDAMFKSEVQDCIVVELPEVKLSTAKEMLQYIYTGKIEDLSMDRATDLYVAADRYDLQELKGWCRDFILQHISANDVGKVAILADLHCDEKLANLAKRVFKEKTKSIVGSEEWKDFAMRNPAVYANLVESAL
ncbi:speckle-type POZ protein-like [Uloborus diversus]|uniref:speckle-type POZ protein-like n=1 Tax=Uloborus diversus TaxID=327109 RepID=UPI00240A065C|nr:speckle-type POZ protein-like [Uloborus diversus]